MRFLGLLIFFALAIGAVAWEWMWRIEHGAVESSSALSPSGQYIAQVMSLSEGDLVPYGQGVFVRHPRIPLWSTSTLVFAGYCRPEIRLQWYSARELNVKCTVSEGTPKLLSAPDDLVVTLARSGS